MTDGENPSRVRATGHDDEDVTSPKELLERDLTPDEREIVRCSRRNASDPATFEDIVKLSGAFTRERTETRSGNRELERQLISLLDRPPNEAALKIRQDLDRLSTDLGRMVAEQGEQHDQLADVQRSMRLVRWIGGAIATLILGSITFIVDRVWSRAEHEGETTIRIDHLERGVEQLRQDLRDDRPSRHYNQPKDSP